MQMDEFYGKGDHLFALALYFLYPPPLLAFLMHWYCSKTTLLISNVNRAILFHSDDMWQQHWYSLVEM